MPRRKDGEKHPIALLREESGLTQEKVTKLAKVSRKAIVDWESGNSIPSLERAARLAQLYRVSMVEILQCFDIDTSKIPDDPPNP